MLLLLVVGALGAVVAQEDVDWYTTNVQADIVQSPLVTPLLTAADVTQWQSIEFNALGYAAVVFNASAVVALANDTVLQVAAVSHALGFLHADAFVARCYAYLADAGITGTGQVPVEMPAATYVVLSERARLEAIEVNTPLPVAYLACTLKPAVYETPLNLPAKAPVIQRVTNATATAASRWVGSAWRVRWVTRAALATDTACVCADATRSSLTAACTVVDTTCACATGYGVSRTCLAAARNVIDANEALAWAVDGAASEAVASVSLGNGSETRTLALACAAAATHGGTEAPRCSLGDMTDALAAVQFIRSVAAHQVALACAVRMAEDVCRAWCVPRTDEVDGSSGALRVCDARCQETRAACAAPATQWSLTSASFAAFVHAESLYSYALVDEAVAALLQTRCYEDTDATADAALINVSRATPTAISSSCFDSTPSLADVSSSSAAAATATARANGGIVVFFVALATFVVCAYGA